MKKILYIILCALISSCASAPKADLQETISTGTKLLRSGQVEEFYRYMLNPESLNESTIDELVKTLDQDEMDETLYVLSEISKIEPTLSEDGYKATFIIPVEEGPRETVNISFIKINDRWYATN